MILSLDQMICHNNTLTQKSGTDIQGVPFQKSGTNVQEVPFLIPFVYATQRTWTIPKNWSTRSIEVSPPAPIARLRLLAGGDTGLGALGSALAVRRERAALAAEHLLLVALLLSEAALALLLALLAAPLLLAVLAAAAAATRRALVVALRGHAAARPRLQRLRRRDLVGRPGRRRGRYLRALRDQQARGRGLVEVILVHQCRQGGAGCRGDREKHCHGEAARARHRCS